MNKLIKDLKKTITDKDVKIVAQSIGLSYAHLKAILVVETSGKGFIEVNGVSTLLPTVRFEEHKFSEYTKGIYDEKYPDISASKANGVYDAINLAEYKRFEKAYALDGPNAVYATSWGLGQIMGVNWKVCGYDNLTQFLNDAFTSEYTQLLMLSYFIKYSSKTLYKSLLERKWDKVALLYNGRNYKQNNYDIKLEKAYNRYAESEHA